jgi:hypothetical protein
VLLAPEDGVIRSRVLPGLQFRLADLISQPAPEAMRTDPIYADFVLPGWQQEIERRAAAEAQVRQEAERALAELQEQLASRP